MRLLALPPGFGPRHLVAVGTDRATLVGELTGEVALLQVSGGAARVLDIVPATHGGGGQPSGIDAIPEAVFVTTRPRSHQPIRDRPRPARATWEAAVPGHQPRALAITAGRLLVSGQDADVLASYRPDERSDASATTVARDVSDLGIVPAHPRLITL